MVAHYYPISLKEMEEFLEPKGFKRIDLGPAIREVVLAKGMSILDVWGNRIPLSLRIYTSISIDYNGARDVGKDAIRVCLFAKVRDKTVMIIGDKRVNRVENWKNNLQDRLNKWEEGLTRCPNCNWPMAKRKRHFDGKEFWGCVCYPECKGIRNI